MSDAFNPAAKVFALSSWHKIQLLWKIFFSNFICLTPFSQLWLINMVSQLTDSMTLMKEYVLLTTAAMKMGERHFYSDHSNGC